MDLLKKPKITLLWALYIFREGIIPPNLSIAYLSKVLGKAGFEVRCIDCDQLVYGKWGYDAISPKDKDVILSRIISEVEKTSPDILGIGFWNEGVSFVKEFVKSFKERNPDVKIILGGHLPTFFPEKILDFIPQADCIARGEGDLTILELVKTFSKGNNIKDVLGVSYKDSKSRVINNPERPLISRLDDLPLIDFENFTYTRKLEGVHMVTSRGCPFTCNYCPSSQFYKNHYRFYSPDYIINQIKRFIDLYGVRYVSFSDDNFLCIPERVKKLLNLIIENDFDCEFPASARSGSLNEEIMTLLKKAKSYWLTVGIENIVPKVLNYYNRTQNPEKYLSEVSKSIQLIKDHEFGAGFSFVIGSPVETEEDMMTNLRFMQDLHSNGFKIYASFLRLVPGSFFWQQYIKGKIKLINIGSQAGFPFDKPYSDVEWICPHNFILKNNNYTDSQMISLNKKITDELIKMK